MPFQTYIVCNSCSQTQTPWMGGGVAWYLDKKVITWFYKPIWHGYNVCCCVTMSLNTFKIYYLNFPILNTIYDYIAHLNSNDTINLQNTITPYACCIPEHGFPCFTYVQIAEVRGDCSFWWYWWNCWPSLFKVSFHNCCQICLISAAVCSS